MYFFLKVKNPILYPQTGWGMLGIFVGARSMSTVYRLPANIYKLAGYHLQQIGQLNETKACMNNGKLQILDLMQPCYLGVSFVSLN